MTVKVNGVPLYGNIELADTFRTRFRGLMGRRGLAPYDGLLLKNCSSIHCFFMRFTIDVVYLGKDLSVIGKETVRPWRTGRIYNNVKHVLELPEGGAESVCVGDRLEFASHI